uniref:hypothetical protein n=1 Tax=Coccidioides posadasii TaxID=199306 RepID=UPI001D02BD4D
KNITIINLFFSFILFLVIILKYFFFYNIVFLSTIETIYKNGLKKDNKILRLNKQDYISIPSSFLAFFIGLIDGKGYIQINKTPKGFITIKLIISLDLKDLSTLEYIYSVLKLGKINIYKDIRNPTCKLIINKTDLQEVFFPLIIYKNIFFLTDIRANQFNLAMYILKNDIKMYSQISDIKKIPIIYELPKNPFDYTLLHYFKNWIVGFTVSEGSFFIKNNKEGYFQLKQRIHSNLFEALKLIFYTNREIDIINNYNHFSVSSKSDIQKVINFFSFSGLHPLIGLKYIQYIKWLNNLRENSPYSNLTYPQ